MDRTLLLEHSLSARRLVVERNISANGRNERDFVVGSGRRDNLQTHEFGELHDRTVYVEVSQAQAL